MIDTISILDTKQENKFKTRINFYKHQICQLKEQINKLNMELMLLRNAVDQSVNQETEQTIFLRCGSQIKKHLISEIILIKAESNYSFLYFADGTQHLTSKTLKHWEKALSGHSDVVRIHRTYLINKTKIKNVDIANSEIHLNNGEKAKISRNMKKEFYTLLNN